jgi:KUP system potassium uptake protein
MTAQTLATGETSETRKFLVLLLGSIGVVYGDIGTSPLYAFREALRVGFHAELSRLGA